jgi:Fic family protein
MTKRYAPPFTVTAGMVSQVAAIAESLGRLDAIQGKALRLRRINRIRSIRGSLAIEGNTLSEAQITAILDGEPVIAPPREVLEARNALAAYENLPHWQPAQEKHLLAAHACLMKGLADDAGRYRRGGVGVMQGKKVLHMAPPANRVPTLMKNLLRWLADTDQHPLIASSVFHYEFEFIHPFSDGNGRMGRLWQTLILSRWNPLFAHVPVESLVHAHQSGYYAALNDSTRRGDSGVFIEFMLARLLEAIEAAGTARKAPVKTPVKTRVKTDDQILALLRKQPSLTLAEVAEHLGKSTSAIERAARKLRDAGRLRYVGPQRGGHWELMP